MLNDLRMRVGTGWRKKKKAIEILSESQILSEETSLSKKKKNPLYTAYCGAINYEADGFAASEGKRRFESPGADTSGADPVLFP